MSFTVSLSEASSLAVTVPYTLTGTATGGSDYETPASTSLAIPAGDASGTIVVKVKGDALDEPNETIDRRVRRRQLDHGDRDPERRFEPGDHPDGRRRGRLSGGNGRLHPQRHDPDHRGWRHRTRAR